MVRCPSCRHEFAVDVDAGARVEHDRPPPPRSATIDPLRGLDWSPAAALADLEAVGADNIESLVVIYTRKTDAGDLRAPGWRCAGLTTAEVYYLLETFMLRSRLKNLVLSAPFDDRGW